MPIYVKENDVAEFLDMPSAIQALRDAFAARARALAEAVIVPRTRWVFGDKRLNVMGGGLTTQQRYALKSYGSSAYHVLLYGPKGLLAIVESNNLGQIRTGAATGVATEKMTRAGAGKVALIGTGRQARTQALALKAVGRLNALAVSGRDRGRLETFCAKLKDELGVPVRAAASGEDAVAGADIVVAATNSAVAGGDERLGEARYACRGHGRQCGQSPRDRCGDRAARLAPGHRRCRAGQDGSWRIHRPHQSRQARLEQGKAAA